MRWEPALATEIAFSILGPLEAAKHSEAVRLPVGKPRSLLALLIVRANELIPAEELVEELWGTKAPRTAATALQGYVSQLRKVLEGQPREPRVLVTRPPGYQLVITEAQLDSRRFELLLASGEQALAGGEAQQATTLLSHGLALWRGSALADFRYDSWAQGEIARLEELRIRALEARIEAELALGRHEQVVAELEALVDAHPLRERLRAQLMLALYRAGRQAEALERYQRAREALVEQLGIDPGPELQGLERAILRQERSLDPEPAEGAPRARLPAPPTPLIGRREELAAAVGFLRGETRLLTLVGTGGTGKTRLALEAAWLLAPEFDQHACFVDLALVESAADVPAAIAQTLELRERPGEPLLETLAGVLAKRRWLLLLDNFEHLLEAATGVADLLGAAPRLKVLVTSREPLRIQAEQEYHLDPLTPADAVALFCERARSRDPAFELEDAGSVAEICRRLDRLPLALELAAARVRSLPPKALLERLDRRLQILTGGARDAPRRQQTLRAAIDWSYDVLRDDEQVLMRRLSVFAGGGRADAVAVVCTVAELDPLDGLASLTEKSLLRRQIDTDGEPRFTMLETIREYAAERLDEAGETAELRRGHAEYFCGVAAEAEPELAGPRQGWWLERLESDHENLLAATRWSIGAAPELALRLGATLGPFWDRRGHLQQGTNLLRDALAGAAGSESDRARALRSLAWLLVRRGDRAAARAAAEEAHALFTGCLDPAGIARCLSILSFLSSDDGDLGAATALGEQTRALVRELNDSHAYEVATSNLAYYALRRGDFVQARTLAAEGLALQRELGNTLGVAVSLLNLAGAAVRLGDDARATGEIAEALELAGSLGFPGLLADCLCVLAIVEARAEGREAAARLVGAADGLYDRAGAEPESFERETREHALAAARELEPGRFDAAYALGRGEDAAAAIAFARECSAALASI